MFVVREVKACCQASCVECRRICCSGQNSCNSVVGYCTPWPSWCVVGLLVSGDESEYGAVVA